MATQAQVDSFNAAIASGNFGLAADIAAGAGYGAADVEAYIEANAGNLGFDPGIDIPSDLLLQVTLMLPLLVMARLLLLFLRRYQTQFR
jgi:hypothetical protein